MNNYSENKYSKQMYIYDEIYQNRINNTKIFISGLGGLGLEIAKNLILSGVKCVMLHDICDTTIYDLSSQYFLSNKDLKKNRAVMSRDRLADLNKDVEVYVSTLELSEDLIKNYDIVILTDSSIEEQKDINNICRNNNLYFISAITRGLVGQLFCDFGEEYIVEDEDGKNIEKSFINYISKEGIIVCSEYTKHNILLEGFIRIFNIKEINPHLKLKKSLDILKLKSIFIKFYFVRIRPDLSLARADNWNLNNSEKCTELIFSDKDKEILSSKEKKEILLIKINDLV